MGSLLLVDVCTRDVTVMKFMCGKLVAFLLN